MLTDIPFLGILSEKPNILYAWDNLHDEKILILSEIQQWNTLFH